MKKYIDLIEQTFDFPSEEFSYQEDQLFFNQVDLMKVIQQYGTPLKLTYLPKISRNIQKAKKVFAEAMTKYQYEGKYIYSYCTKASHFSFILEEVLKNDIKLETSSAYDMRIMRKLYDRGMISKDMMILCNGYKPERYRQRITEMINEGFVNCTPILDCKTEIDHYAEHITTDFPIGIRVAADEEPSFGIYTSRMGLRYGEVNRLYEEKIKSNPRIQLKLLHFFIHSGINDTTYYWSELNKFIYKYCELRKECDTLTAIDIGGGFPIKNTLDFEYDHGYMAEQIILLAKEVCSKMGVPVPDIITEFGNYTVGESGCVLYSVLEQKLQNDKELWYIIDGSLITQIPDIWGKNQKFIFLAINNLRNDYVQLNIGGITCDSDDYYNLEKENRYIFLPRIQEKQEQYVGFFHTGAYQESLGGYGGLQHCLIPSPKHVLIQQESNGTYTSRLFAEEQHQDTMMSVLGYD